jgi:hypothetical protein
VHHLKHATLTRAYRSSQAGPCDGTSTSQQSTALSGVHYDVRAAQQVSLAYSLLEYRSLKIAAYSYPASRQWLYKIKLECTDMQP